MNKVLSWHKKNIDKVVEETANNRDYKYTYAMALAIQYILDRMSKQEEKIKYYERVTDNDQSFSDYLTQLSDLIENKSFIEDN